MDGERVVEPQEARVRISEDLDHHGQLHGAGGVEPQIRADQERVGAGERPVVKADGTAGRAGDARFERGAQCRRLLSGGGRRTAAEQREHA